ncbi:hypothetical protein F183_A35760 [Bryobacterales bacterium F-183]|nr:hypothetical protein F183_A35760 [Bryobacterales bacterium F-183]
MKRVFAGLLVCVAGFAQQLTVQQRVDDFQYLAGIVARNSATIGWKKQAFGFDARNLTPWLERVRAAKDDVEYYDILIEYTASFQDYYTYLTLPSDFAAWMAFTTDVYDGKVIVQTIDRSILSTPEYDIAIGDEVVSIDGRPVADLLRAYGKYFVDSNPEATRRAAAELLTYRLQSFMPVAAQIGTEASVVLKKANGDMVTLVIPWERVGTPLRVGPVPDITASSARMPGVPRTPRSESAAAGELLLHERVREEIDSSARRRVRRPAAVELNAAAQVESVLPRIEGIGSLTPIYELPETFVQRRGTSFVDWFFSGSFTSAGKRVGLIRFAEWSTSSTFASQLDAEVAWMNANTDVLVIDQMRDDLTSICGSEAAAARFIGKGYRQPGLQFRATWANVQTFQATLDSAIEGGSSAETIALYQGLVDELRAKYYSGGGNTEPFPFCGTSLERNPARQSNGTIVNYEKPILLLTDELSSDHFAATVKDNREFPVKQFGMATSGRLGVSINGPGGAYTETTVHVKDGVAVRAKATKRPGFPETTYLENAGVYPEIVQSYMTMENLTTKGAAYVAAFTKAALELIQ